MNIALFLLTVTVFLRSTGAKSDGANKPHIIIILVDDLGWNDVGFHGSDQIPTPNIDALAYSGIILNRHYVLPMCTPSRASLLTGSYPIRTGMHGYPMKCGTRRGIPLSVKLQPQYLKDLGYSTHLVGKWHLGYYSPEHIPNRRGFDSFFGYYNGYIEYFKFGIKQNFEMNNTTHTYYGYDLHDNDDIDQKWKGNYATRVFTNRAHEIIDRHNKSQPLYLLMSHLGVHTGIEQGTGLEVPQDMNIDSLFSYIKSRPRRELAGMIKEVDDSVDIVVDALHKNNILENSIILFMSDNGGHTVSTDMDPNWSSNWPLRGAKFNMFEGGIRGAALIWSPLLPKGVVSEQFLHISDWLPTLYHAAGGNVSDLNDLDGMNQWNALQETSPVYRDHILINIDEVEGDEGIIIKNRWKVKKGGLRKYANYDYHWGEERNLATPPDYVADIGKSRTGQIVSKLAGYDDVFTKTNIKELRRKSQVKCNVQVDPNRPEAVKGFVEESKKFLCSEYCVFDLVSDPCELTKIDNKEVVRKAVKLLNRYKRELRPQGDNSVDPLSDPKNHDGAWMPWVTLASVFSKSE